MRFSSLPASLISLLTISLIQPVSGGLIPDLLETLEDLQNLGRRNANCAVVCGYYGQLCCSAGQVCYTDSNNQAQCGAGGAPATQVAATPAAGGGWQYYTTTYVQTDLKTVTATFSSYVAAATQTCSYAQGQTPCGTMCCNSGQYCSQPGTCMAVPGSSGYYSSLATVTVTNTAGAPLRPTSNSVTTLTSTGVGASTVPFQTPVGTGGATVGVSAEQSSGGLSGGAIAGIVIGVIAGIILLLLLCACCCAKGLIDGLLGIFGLGGRRRTRREEVEVIEERHHSGGRTWYGANRPTGGTVVEEKRKKESGFGNFAKAGIFLGGLAAILGLKRKADERRDDKSSAGYSYYDSEYYTSSSSSSSGARTRSRSRSRI